MKIAKGSRKKADEKSAERKKPASSVKSGRRSSTRRRASAVLYQVPVPVKRRKVAGKKSKSSLKKKEEKTEKGKKGRKVKKTITGKVSKGKKAKKSSSGSKKGNERLVKRTGIQQYSENPFFSKSVAPDFVSVRTYHRWLIRAIERKDAKEMKEVMSSPRLSQLHLTRNISYADSRTAEMAAVLCGNLNVTQEYYKLKRKIDNTKIMSEEPNLLEKKKTGRSNFYMIGRATRPVEMTRGGREGNNALLNYEKSKCADDVDHVVVEELIRRGTPYKEVHKLFKHKDLPELNSISLHSHLVTAARLGMRELAGAIAEGEAKYQTNELHRTTLNGGKLPDRILQVSVVKKAFNNRNITPLHTAAINPDVKHLERLRSVDPNINIPDQDNWFTIHYASACSGPAPLQFLLKNGASPSALTKKHESPLHVAAVAGRPANIKVLLDTIVKLEAPSDPTQVVKPERSLMNIRTRSGDTALLLAVRYNRIDSVKALLECPTVLPDIPSSTTTNKLTPLMLACSLGHLPIAKLLIEKGALVEGKDKKKRTALIHAVLNGQLHTAAMLIEIGANIVKGDSSGNTAAHYASAYGWLDCLKLIASVEPDCLNAENDWKMTPLSVAYLKGHYGIVSWLLDGPYQSRVNINGKDMDGVSLLSSLLRYADESCHHQLHMQIDFLLDRGADCGTCDSLGNTILHDFAGLKMRIRAKEDKKVENGMTEQQYKQCFEQLLNGAPDAVTARNQHGLTPVHVALRSCNLRVFTRLTDSLTDANHFFSKDWSLGGNDNLLFDLLTLPMRVWTSCAANEVPAKDVNDVVPFIKKSLMTFCCAEIPLWLNEKDKEGLQPVLQAVRSYCQLKEKRDVPREKVESFVHDVCCLFDEICVVNPSCLLQSSPVLSSRDKKDTANPPISLVHSALSVPLETGDLKHALLKTLLDVAARSQCIRDALSLSCEDRSLIVAAIERDAAASRLILRAAVEHNCTQGVHDAVLSHTGTGKDRKRVDKTVLMLAIEHREFDLVSELELSNADWNAKDADGNTVWHYAARTSHHRTISLFKTLQTRNIPRTGNNLGATPLHVAVQSCDGSANAVLEPIEWLAAKGNVALRDVFGRTALHYAFATNDDFTKGNLASSRRDPIGVVSILTGALHKKEIDIADNSGNTALHVAAIKDANICAVSLIRKGASIQLKNSAGNTPLALAVLHGRQPVALTLIQADSDVTAKVVPTQPEKAKDSVWLWDGARKEVEKVPESTVPAQIVSKGSGWEAMVYVLLDALGKNIQSLSQLTMCALKESQYNLANQLLKSIDAILDGKSLNFNEDLVLAFSQHFQGSLDAESVEMTVLKRLLSLGCPFVSNGVSIPMEKAIQKGAWSLAHFFKKELGSEWCNLRSSEQLGGPLKSLLLNQMNGVTEEGTSWLTTLLELKNIEGKTRSLDLPISSFLSAHIPGPFHPISWAALTGKPKMVDWLRAAGCDTNAPDSMGRTPLMLAIAANQWDSIATLCSDGQPAEVVPNRKRPAGGKQSNLVFGNFIQAKRKRRPTGGDSEEEDSENDSDDDEEETSESESEPESESEKTKSKQLKITNKQLNLFAVDNEGRNAMHYLVGPIGWENVPLLLAFHKQQPVVVRKLLQQQDKAGQDPIDVACELQQKVMRAAMLKIVGNGAKRDYPVINSNLSLDLSLQCPYDVTSDSSAFLRQWSIDNDKKKSAETKVPRPSKLSGYRDTGVLVDCPETGQKLTVLLSKTDLNYGRYGFHNFYRMELIKRNDANLWILFTNWGRIGQGSGEHQTTPFNTLEAGLKEFKSVWKSKTGNEWADLANFVETPKKYRLVQVDESASSLAEIDLPAIEKKKEEDPVRAFVKDISDPEKLKNYSETLRGQNRFSCPFGRVTGDAISRARRVLDECEAVIRQLDKGRDDNTISQDELLSIFQKTNDLSSEFYAAIQCGNSEFSALTRIDSEDTLSKARTSLNRLEEVEIATQILTAAAHRKEIDRIDYISSAINSKLSLLNPKEEMSQNILQWIHNSSSSPPDIQGILSVESLVSMERFIPFANDERQMLLFHGTRAVNLLSILRHGLLVDPLNSQLTGRLFGEGLYFADAFEKSSHYCQPSAAGVKYMLICQVAVGRLSVKPAEDYSDSKIPNTDTLHMEAETRPSGSVTIDGVSMPLCPLTTKMENRRRFGYGAFSEYIVRDGDRVLPRYIVMYK